MTLPKRQKIILCILVFLTYSINSYGATELKPPEIMDQYGDAVVLIATVSNGTEAGLGSGFIVKDDGVVVTNYHVIEGAYPALVKLKNGDIYEDISVIGYNERKDIAVIKIKGFDLPIVKLGNSNKVRVGEEVVVIGNPHGLENTIADGLLSQVRDAELGYKLHQISAPISAGSSGSPVFNLRGEVIGIATLSDTLGQNINFSVPINYVRAMINGPVKYSLKEFSGVEKEKTVLGKLKPKKTLEKEEFVDKFCGIVSDYLLSEYIYSIGYKKTFEYEKKNKKSWYLLVDSNMFTAEILLEDCYKRINEISCNDNKLREMQQRFSEGLSGFLENAKKELHYFKLKKASENANLVKEVQAKMTVYRNKYLMPTIGEFVEYVHKDYPEYINKLPPFFARRPGKDDIDAENKPVLGFRPFFGAKEIIIFKVLGNGPADKAGLKSFDKIIGIKNGPTFPTMTEYTDYIENNCKPGDTIKLTIERESLSGSKINKTIAATLQKRKDVYKGLMLPKKQNK